MMPDLIQEVQDDDPVSPSIPLPCGGEIDVNEIVYYCDLYQLDPLDWATQLVLERPTLENILLLRSLAERRGYDEGVDGKSEGIRHSAEMFTLLACGIAHDLRNPLAVISGYVQLIPDGEVSGDDVSLLHTIAQEIQVATARATEMMETIARVVFNHDEASPPIREWIEHEFRVSVDSYVREHSEDYILGIEIHPGVHGYLVNRPLMLEAMRQTLSNAIKYASPAVDQIPNINIRLTIEEHEDEVTFIVFEIENQAGTPLPSGFQAALSKEFNPSERNVSLGSSLGNGMKILKRLCDAKGVVIEASNTDQGNPIFRFRFPCRRIEPTDLPQDM